MLPGIESPVSLSSEHRKEWTFLKCIGHALIKFPVQTKTCPVAEGIEIPNRQSPSWKPSLPGVLSGSQEKVYARVAGHPGGLKKASSGSGRASREQWHTRNNQESVQWTSRPTYFQAEGRLWEREQRPPGPRGRLSRMLDVCPGAGWAGEAGEEAQNCPLTAIKVAQGWDLGVGWGGSPPACSMEGITRREGVRRASPGTHPLTHSWPSECQPVPRSPEPLEKLLGSEAWARPARSTLSSPHGGWARQQGKGKRQASGGWWGPGDHW